MAKCISEQVDHKALEYVRRQVHTNNIESFWSLLKRGIIGTFHQVRSEYPPLYLNESKLLLGGPPVL